MHIHIHHLGKILRHAGEALESAVVEAVPEAAPAVAIAKDLGLNDAIENAGNAAENRLKE